MRWLYTFSTLSSFGGNFLWESKCFATKTKQRKKQTVNLNKVILVDGFLRHQALLPTLDGLVLCYQYEKEDHEVDKDLKNICIEGIAEVAVPRCSVKNVFFLQL